MLRVKISLDNDCREHFWLFEFCRLEGTPELLCSVAPDQHFVSHNYLVVVNAPRRGAKYLKGKLLPVVLQRRDQALSHCMLECRVANELVFNLS